MPRIRTQLAIQVPPELLARLKAAATAQGRTLTAVCVDWLEAGLAGAVAAPAGGELLARLDAMDARLRRLEAREAPSPLEHPAMPLAPPAAAPVVGVGERLTTAELARRTGANPGTLRAWAASNPSGSVREISGERFRLVVTSGRGKLRRHTWERLV